MHHILMEPYILAMGWAGVCFDLPFEQYGFKKVWGVIPSDNEKGLNFARKLGFRDVTVIPEYWGDEIDCQVLRMDRDDWRKSKWAGKAAAT